MSNTSEIRSAFAIPRLRPYRARRTKSLRQRAGEASWRYLLGTTSVFVALGVLLRCCEAGLLS